jgi:hypothetical protein
MRRNRRILLIAILSALAVFGAIAIVLIYRWQQPRIRERIIVILSENLDSKVELGDVDVSLGATVSVTAHGLVLRHREHPNAAPLLTVDRFSAEAPITALLHTPVHIASINVVGLHISIPPRHHDDHDGADFAEQGPDRSDLTGALGRPTPVIVDRLTSDGAVLEIGVRKPGRPPRTFQIHHVRLTGAAFDRPTQFHAELTNPIPSGLIVADGTIGPWQPYEPALTKVEGSYTFNNADLSTIDGIGGRLDSTGQFTGRLEQIAVTGETRTPDFTLDIGGEPLPLNTTFSAIVDGTNGDTVLDAVSATLGHTPLHARGGVVHMGTQKDRTVELDVRIDDGRLEDILRLALKDEPPAMFGGLHLETHLELPPGRGKVPLRLKLNGHFRVAEARFSSNTVRLKIDELSRRGRGAPADTSVSNVASRLQGAFVLGGGVLSLSHVSFAVRGADILMAGRYRLVPGTLDFAGTARLDAHVSEMVTGWKRLPLKILDPLFSRDGAGTVLPISVTGPASKPNFKVDVGKIFHRENRTNRENRQNQKNR